MKTRLAIFTALALASSAAVISPAIADAQKGEFPKGTALPPPEMRMTLGYDAYDTQAKRFIVPA